MKKTLILSSLLSMAVFACSDHGSATDDGAREALSSTPAYYEVYRPGDPTTDQNSGAPGSRSYLVGTYAAGSDVGDQDFADHVAKPALDAGARLFITLNQCYGGGFLDNVAPLGGDQFLFTAARHSETAAYGYGAPGGVDIDSTDAFLTALADGNVPAERVAANAVAMNPFGPNPNAARINERVGSEHAQYFASGTGADLRPALHARTGLAILWAGQPATRDGTQMKTMTDRLVDMGYTRDRIWFLYGDGLATADHPIVKSHIAGVSPAVNLRAATKKQLTQVIAEAFAPSARTKPDFVFLYVGDHGGLNGKSVAKPGFEPDPFVAPNALPDGAILYGAGDSDL